MKLGPLSRAACFCTFTLTSLLAFGQDAPKAELTLERLYSFPLVNGRSPSGPAMSPDGRMIAFSWNQTGVRKLDLWVMDFPSGAKRRIVDANTIKDLPNQDDTRTEEEKKEREVMDGGIGGIQWSPDSKEILFSYKGRHWTVRPDGRNLNAIVDGTSSFGSLRYSPDGKYLSYNQGQNLFRMDRKTRQVKQLTFISKAGTTISRHSWSPDSKQILVFWSDDSKVGNHVMMDFSKDRATVVNIRRQWNGDLSVNQQIGLVPADGGIIRFVPDIPRYHWAEETAWAPDSSAFLYSYNSDDFKRFTLLQIPVNTLKPFAMYEEVAPSNYNTDWRPILWSRDSKHVYLGTDLLDGKFANRSVVRMQRNGKGLERVYAEDHDVGAMMRPKQSDRIILVTAGRTPLKTEITILEPDGKRTVHVVSQNGYSTPKGFNWAELPLVSEDGTKIATLASERKLNSELFAVEPVSRRLTESQLPEFKQIAWADEQEVTFQAPDGSTIRALMLTKPGLDKTKRHPAIVSGVYADSAKRSWAGWMENYAAMNLGMVVLCVDFRASWGYGGLFNSGYYKQMGLIDVEEAVAARKFLAGLSFVQGDRVGIWGWSYGGFLTCMALLTKPGEFHAGVAVASVTDWKSYNEWYTRRRLGLVRDDKDKVFEKTSPITHAAGLKDNLLLVHGMLDDNVLAQDSMRLAHRFIEAGKRFDMLMYPRDDHGINRDRSRPHVMASIMRYLELKLREPSKAP